jgi:hypothetical protein
MAGEEQGGDPQEVGKSLPEMTDRIDREKEAFCDNGMPLFFMGAARFEPCDAIDKVWEID